MREEISNVNRYIIEKPGRPCLHNTVFSERMLNAMKKLCFLSLLLALLLCLCSTATAEIWNQQQISYIADANGYVTSLTDGNNTTTWTKQDSYGADLTLYMNYASVGEIWIRNGHTYSTNYYQHYDRAAKVKVAVYYYVNQYTESYDTYRYNLTDAYRPNTVSKSWSNGYQRLLLPKQYRNVTKLELTIESVVLGAGRTGATISDIIVASGNFATATPKSYATATPKPWVVTITATPGPQQEEDDYVDPITPYPGYDDEHSENRGDNDNPYVEQITPPTPTRTPTVTVVTPTPTEPLVELITPVPSSSADYPSETGVIGYTKDRIPTRYGPSNGYGEPGSFFSAGHEVKIITRTWDSNNDLYWYQLEFKDDGEWMRAYTTDYRIEVADTSLIPSEVPLSDPLDVRRSLVEHPIYYGPGENYKQLGTLGADKRCPVYNIENGWVQVEYVNYANNVTYRGWVPLFVVYDQ